MGRVLIALLFCLTHIVACNDQKISGKSVEILGIERVFEKYDVLCGKATTYSEIQEFKEEGSFDLLIKSKTDNVLQLSQVDEIESTLRGIVGRPATDLYALMGCYETELIAELKAEEGFILSIAIGKPSFVYNFLVRIDTIRFMTQLTTASPNYDLRMPGSIHRPIDF